ncbi:MAG: Fic family protein [Deltaproteobacteria bacterium]|jgi:Fic family protein|nr:Fic family protein [Deltaproteobacteria bacterium]
MSAKKPFTITGESCDVLADIVDSLLIIDGQSPFVWEPRLKKKARAKAIYATLALRGNRLSLDETRDIIESKTRLPSKSREEFREVKNASQVYDQMSSFNPYSLKDFLKAHKLMTLGLGEGGGSFRKSRIGYFDGRISGHYGTRPELIPDMMATLFTWGQEKPSHPVIKSAIFHYHIQLIRPFALGNGRLGRFWQTLILANWKEVFEFLPIEMGFFSDDQLYRFHIETAHLKSSCGDFIEYSLLEVYKSLDFLVKLQEKKPRA